MGLLTLAEVPADIQAIAREVARFLEVPVTDLLIGDHEHRNLPPGAWTIASEGAMYDWPSYFHAAVNFTRKAHIPDGWHLDNTDGCTMTIWPKGEPITVPDAKADTPAAEGASEPTVADRVAEWGITADVKAYDGRKTLDVADLTEGLRAWTVTLTLDGRTFDQVVVVDNGTPPTAADALEDARADAVSFREFEDDPEWDELQRAEMKADADKFLAWLGEDRYVALLDETEDPDE